MADPRFTATDKAKAVRRELGWRRKVYPDRVAAGRMTEAESARQIAIFEAIEADYRTQAEAEKPDLFGVLA